MQKMKWNAVIFMGYIAYCLLFAALFWTVFVHTELDEKYFELTFLCLHLAFGINAVSQFIAILQRQKHAAVWLVFGTILWLLTIAFTTAQGV